MARWRKRPIEVEAIRWDGALVEHGHRLDDAPSPPLELTRFAAGHVSMVCVGSVTHGGPNQWLPCIGTLEGRMVINPGDYLVRGLKGEFYPVKPDIFHATYEPVDAPDGSLAP